MNDTTRQATINDALTSHAICHAEARAATTEADRKVWLDRADTWLELSDDLQLEADREGARFAPVLDIEILEERAALEVTRMAEYHRYLDEHGDDEPTPPPAAPQLWPEADTFEWEAAA